MGFLGFLGGQIVKPVTSTVKVVQGSRARLGAQIQELRLAQARRREQIDLSQRELDARVGPALTDAQLAQVDVKDLEDPRVRFRAVCIQKGLTPAAVAKRLAYLRVRRRISLVACLGSLLFGLAMPLFVVKWKLLLFSPLLLVFFAMTFAAAFRDGLFQAQLEQRSLFDFRIYLAREDLIRHLLG